MVGFAASALLQFVFVLLVTHGEAPGSAGVVFEALALFTILSNWGELGADTGVVRSVPRLLALQRTRELRPLLVVAFLPVLATGLVVALVVFVFAHQVAHVFFDAHHRHGATSVIRAVMPFLALSPLATVALAASRGFRTMLPYVAIQNIGLPLARVLGVLVPLVLGLGSLGVTVAWAAPVALTAIVALLIVRRLAEAATAGVADHSRRYRALATEFWSFSAPRGLAALFGVTITWLDVLLVGAMTSARSAAVYAAASRLAVLGAYAMQAVGMAVSPEFSALLAENRIKVVESLYQMATSWTMTFFWPAYLTLAIFAPLIMRIFGHSYGDGATALLILSLAGLLNLATGNSTMLLLMSGRSSLNLLNAGVSLALNIGLNLALIPKYGASGAALAWAVSIATNNVAAVVELRYVLGVHLAGPSYLAAASASALCFGGLGLLIRWFFPSSPTTLAIFVAVATPSYAILLWRARGVLQLHQFVGAIRRTRYGSLTVPAGSSNRSG
jgi:O-antigen/teichoic acid export membrane protein